MKEGMTSRSVSRLVNTWLVPMRKAIAGGRRPLAGATVILLTISVLAFWVPVGAQNADRPVAPQKSGEIRGEVDFCGPAGNTGIMVHIAGESFGARLAASGTFALRYVPVGTYNLTIEIPGKPKYVHAGVTTADNTVTNLGQIEICRDSDQDGATEATDCNDNNAAINPSATEICNGVDDDCDGVVDEGCASCTDSDTDGFFAQFGCLTAVDCNDSDPLIRPTATEACDELDNNCDGQTDEGFDLQLDPTNCGACGNVCSFPNAGALCSSGNCELGACGPGFGNCDGDSANGCEADFETDVKNCGGCGAACDVGDVCVSGVCVPDCAWEPELCDGIDNDCDGEVDEDFAPGGSVSFDGGPYLLDGGKGLGQSCGTGWCTGGQVVCDEGGDELTCNTLVNLAAEVCGDGFDNDCDGQIDEGCP